MSSPRIDCHLHLQDPFLLSRLSEVLDRARGAGVEKLVANGSEPADWPVIARLSADHPDTVVPFFGLHPWHIEARTDGWIAELEGYLSRQPSGVGEIGLDRWKEGLDEKGQEEAFRAQLDLARRLGRPVVVHCLRAWGWLMEVLRSERALPAGMMIHAFGGPADLIRPLADMGAYFSFAGDVLDERKLKKRIGLRSVPPDRLLLETDAPDIVIPPHHRSLSFRDEDGRERSEPAHLADLLRGAARIRGESEDRLADLVWENARRFFGPLLGSDPG